MKKLLLAFFVTSLFILSSCTKEYVTNYIPGKSYVYDILPDDWSLKSGTNTYVCNVNIPDLDDVYFEDGHVSLAILYNGTTVYEIIPATVDYYSFSANYSIGKVTVFAEDIGTGAIQKPEAMKIKIVLTDAEIGN